MFQQRGVSEEIASVIKASDVLLTILIHLEGFHLPFIKKEQIDRGISFAENILAKGVQFGTVIFGDVVFDITLGGTILSTEDIFAHLVRQKRPRRMLLAGLESGVWKDYPVNNHLIDEITPSTPDEELVRLTGSAGTDVTGGMASKVRLSLVLVRDIPGLSVSIFSGERPGSVKRALAGEQVGTLIHCGKRK